MPDIQELFARGNSTVDIKPLVSAEKHPCLPLRSVLHGRDFVLSAALGGTGHSAVDGLGNIDSNQAEQELLGEEFQKAYEKGMAEGQATVDAMRQRYQDAISDLAFLRDQILQESEEALLHLAHYTAKQIILGDVDARKGFTEKMLEHALSLLRESDMIAMRVAPDDVVWLKEKRPDLFGEKSIVRIQEDPSLVLGGVVAECNLGRVDATLERRLDDTAKKLIEGTTLQEDEEMEPKS